MTGEPRIRCRIESIVPPAGQTFDRFALGAAVGSELARLFADSPLVKHPGHPRIDGGVIQIAVPASTETSARAIAHHIHDQLTGETRA